MARGDSTTPVFLWFSAIAIAVLLLVWYTKASAVNTNSLSTMDEDLKNLHYDFALACNNDGVMDDIPTKSGPATLTVNTSDMCIRRPTNGGNITRCLPSPCDLGISTSIDFDKATIIRIEKSKTSATLTRK